MVDLGLVYSRKVDGNPPGSTGWFGRNLRACKCECLLERIMLAGLRLHLA
jgi:hypothetical protein